MENETVSSEILWKVLLMRNKGMSLGRIARRAGLGSGPAVRDLIRVALRYFGPDDISELIANNRIEMPAQYQGDEVEL